jgi:large subunit ribosomal protein L27
MASGPQCRSSGRDHTLFALINGRVEFQAKTKGRVFVSVLPTTEAAAQ